MKQAIILAGGKGTRLQERLGGLPKPLVDICGKPLLERQIESLKSYGFDQILILVNHGADQIIHFCNSKNNWNIDVQCLDDGQPRGTAGAAIQVFPRLADEFLVVYGDTMFDIDLNRFQAFHDEEKLAGATLFLHPNDHPHDSDLVAMDEQCRITGFYPYPHDPKVYLPNLVNAGMYYFRKDALKLWVGNTAVLDFGKDIFPALIEEGVVLRGYNSPEYIKDCGTPKRLDKVCAHYEFGLIAASNLRFKQKIIFLDRDGTINRSVDQLANADDFELLPGVAQAISQLNHVGYRVVVVTNQPVLARGECMLEELEAVHRKMQALLGEHGAYVDRIYYCPHHPDSGFTGEIKELKRICNCRKPAIGMLIQAQKDLNADFGASWMIGDSTADILAAQTAGVRSILLETGNAGLDEKYPALPSHISPNLPAAAHFILHDYPRLLKRCELWSKNIRPGDFVLIGGLSRAGKSTLAHCLQEALQIDGKRAHILSVDGWLKAPEYRGPTVMERYDMDALKKLVQSLVNREEDLSLQVPVYSKRALKANGSIERVISPQDVVIIEGAIALFLADVFQEKIVHSWYVQMDEIKRKARLLSEYRLRGKSAQEAESIYAQRLLDEVPLIESSRAYASQQIDLELAGDLS